MKSNGRDLKTFYPRSVRYDNQRLPARKINIRNGNLKILLYCSNNSTGKAYDFIDSEYKAQDVTIFDIDATSFGFQEFPKYFDRDNITKTSSRDIQIKHGFLIMQLLQGFNQLGWIDELTKQSSEYERKIRYIKKFKLVDVLSYGLN